MKPLLKASVLDKMRRTLYGRNVEAVFYALTPEVGEQVIVRITSGFNFVREREKEENNGKVKMWLTADAAINREQLRIGGAVELIVDGQSSHFSISQLFSQQQVGAGYVLRLTPTTGATG